MSSPTVDRTVSGAAHARVLEVVLPASGARAVELTDPGALGAWLVSSAMVAATRVQLVVEEEYGYRRHLYGTVEVHEPGVRLVVVIDRAEREWDGSDGTPVGPPMPPTRWDEPEFAGTRLEMDVRGDIASVRWSDFHADALDATRRVGALLRWATERALEEHDADGFTIHDAARVIDATPADVWGVLDERDGIERWLGADAVLRPDPGSAWRAPASDACGQVALAVAGRRLAVSWGRGSRGVPAGLLDLRIGHERTGGANVRLTLRVDRREVDGAAWTEQALDALVAATTGQTKEQ